MTVSFPLVIAFVCIGANAFTYSALCQTASRHDLGPKRLRQQLETNRNEIEIAAPQAVTLPNGRRITPSGRWTRLAPYPFAIAVRPDGAQVALPSIGWPFALNVLDGAAVKSTAGHARHVTLRQLPPGVKSDPNVQVLAGVAYSADGTLLYDATGDTGAVDVYATRDWRRVGRIPLDGVVGSTTYAHSFAASLTLSPDGKRIYVIDQGNWRLVAIDTSSQRKLWSVPTGANPFAVASSGNGSRLYITNSGLFEYQTVPGVDAQALLKTGLKFPAFGYPSKQAREGAVVDGHTVPGLGSENDPRGSSLWTYDVSDGKTAKLLAKLRLGTTIDGNTGVVGGASPTGVLEYQGRVYVTLAHQDAVAVLAGDGSRVLSEIALSPFSGKTFQDAEGRPLRGVMPAGLAAGGGRLYVAEAGINAVAVLDTTDGHVLGHLPVGWYPSALAVSPDGGNLYVVNTKGQGTGPNASLTTNHGSYIGELEFGSVSTIALPSGNDLGAETKQVIRNNTAHLQLAGQAGDETATEKSRLSTLRRVQHVFLIIRENRTFDEIFGDLPGAAGSPALARWGMHGWLASAPRAKIHAVTPNAHALAQQFATSDQFYVDSDVSADGHRWLVGAEETPWFHIAWTSNYGGRRTSDPFSPAPGRRALNGGNDAPMPEDEPEFGTLWEHVHRAGLSIRNYGEGIEIEGAEEIDGSAPEGERLVLNAPVPQPVFEATDRTYPTFNLGIPDQLRYKEFAQDFARLLAENKVPSLIVIRLPNDHTGELRPADGYTDRASFVADNDLALGKIVDLISHSSAWPQSAILVTEDDAQDGVDHIDAHRSVMLAIGPYVKRGTISHRHTSMGSLQKTAYSLLGIGALNLEDALAGDLDDLFTTTPDLRPYTALPEDPAVFDPAIAKIARPKNAAEARALVDCDDADDIRKHFHKEKRVGAKRQDRDGD